MIWLWYSYWVWVGSMYLFLLTVADFKNKGWVDERPNWFMFGASFALLSHVNNDWWFVLLLLGVIFFLRWFLLKIKAIGEADVQSLLWIFYGFGIIDLFALAWFVFIFLVLYGVFSVLRLYVFKLEKVPFFIVIFLSFVLDCLLFGLFF